MRIGITQEGYLKFSEVFNPIVLENERGERISICQRDGGFEVVGIDGIDEMQRILPHGPTEALSSKWVLERWYEWSKSGHPAYAISPADLAEFVLFCINT